MTTAEYLRAARALIADPANWVQYYNTRVPTCALGALDIVRGHPHHHGAACDALANAMGDPAGVGHFNDTHTHAEVLAAFDRAIEATER